MSQAAADVPIKPAATVVILRDGKQGVETYMVVRHHAIEFASGALVFPGGKLDDDDGADHWGGMISSTEPPSTAAAMALDPAFRIAAVRETFEEAGLLIARRRGAAGLLGGEEAHGVLERRRPGLLDGKAGFSDIVREEGLELATDLMVHFAHWITPPGVPKRFDTHFFLVGAPPEQLARHDGSEAVEGIWIKPGEAVREADAGKRTLVPATRFNLELLATYPKVADAVAATRARKVVTVLPRVVRGATSRSIVIPAEAGYLTNEFVVGKN
jgi:8-oxo-dGTP pyrophosphatase MutT (NUDIX family)